MYYCILNIIIFLYVKVLRIAYHGKYLLTLKFILCVHRKKLDQVLGRTRPGSGLAARPESGLSLIDTALNFWQKIQNLKITGNTITN